MKNILLCCLLLSLLGGCANHDIYTKNATGTKSIAVCKLSCQKQYASCAASCTNNCHNCKIKSTQTAGKNFQKYIHEECVKGGFIARDMNSYRDPLQCRKVSCNCCADLNICIQSCSGVINKQLKAAATCC